MATVEDVAAAHHRRQQTIARRAADRIAQLWRQVDRSAIVQSWAALSVRAFTVLASAQGIAAASSGVYVDDALDAQGLDADADGSVAADRFAGVASDGRDLATLLQQPAFTALAAIKAGNTVDWAMASGLVDLDMIVRTQVADAGRVADGVAITARRHVGGYVRMLSLPSCSRCVILAGRFYQWNSGFRRHPRCDCRHVPSSEDHASDLRTDPRQAFASMSPAEQDRIFTKTGAQAIRDGADMSQVVNARRGASGLAPAGARITDAEARLLRGGGDVGRLEARRIFGQDLFVTTEGTTVRGQAGKRLAAGSGTTTRPGARYRSAKAPRLMPESIYKIAGNDRDEAIRLLRNHGYLREVPRVRPAVAPPIVRPAAPPRPAAPAPLPKTFDQRAAGATTGQKALDAPTFGLDRQARRDLPEGFTVPMADALGSYLSSGFSGLNRQLRGLEVLTGLREREAARDLAGLDALMAVSKLRSDVITYRSVRDASPMFGARLGGDLAGVTWREDAFMSTTAELSQTTFFMGVARPGRTRMVMRILTPTGTPAVEVSDASVEAELLLDRGLRLRVVADRGVDPNGVRHIDAEVLRD